MAKAEEAEAEAVPVEVNVAELEAAMKQAPAAPEPN